MFCRAEETQIGPDGITRIDLIDIRVNMPSIPIVPLIIKLRSIVVKGGSTSPSFFGLKEVNFDLNIVRDSHRVSDA
ncbi:hypothetical protein BJL95_02810 [Methylomonas sp. LWB]|nr:hypothetical protein BJL95_02810 [Methylomonas sp. LWB]